MRQHNTQTDLSAGGGQLGYQRLADVTEIEAVRSWNSRIVYTDVDQALGSLAQFYEASSSKSIFIVVDRHYVRLATTLSQLSLRYGVPLSGMYIHSGLEIDKTLTSVESILVSMAKSNVLRRTLVIGIGGGVICDITGFAASIYMRGLPYLLIPTTLMAQVDASIGGKVGANFNMQKNLIGGFHHPLAVVIDPTTWANHPRRIISAALAEVMKVALISNPGLFAEVENLDLDNLGGQEERIRYIVQTAVDQKLALLRTDPFEMDSLARLLNFGHCVGHAIEAEIGYSWLHGESVAAGMAVAARVGTALGVTELSASARLHGQLERFDLPLEVPNDVITSVWDHLERISRVRNGSLNLVLPVCVGRATIIADWPTAVSWHGVAKIAHA